MTQDPFDPSLPEDDAEREGRLAELFCEYTRKIEAGEPVDRDEIRRRHPDLAGEILEHIESFELVTVRVRDTGGSSDAVCHDSGALPRYTSVCGVAGAEALPK